MQQVEIALHEPVLARRAVYSDVRVVELDHLAVVNKGEVVLIYLLRTVVGQLHVPVLALYIYYIYVVAFLIKE